MTHGCTMPPRAGAEQLNAGSHHHISQPEVAGSAKAHGDTALAGVGEQPAV